MVTIIKGFAAEILRDSRDYTVHAGRSVSDRSYTLLIEYCINLLTITRIFIQKTSNWR